MLFVFHLFYEITVSYIIKCVSEASNRIIYSPIWDRWWLQCNSRYGKKQQEGIFSWTKRLVRQVVQKILDTVLWPSSVTAPWVACQPKLCQTWESTFSAPWDKMVMKCPLKIMIKFMSKKGLCQLKTDTCHLRLQRLNHGRCNCWLSTPLKGVQGENQEWGTLCSGKNWQNRPSDS